MRTIDVDSHFIEPADWLEDVDPTLAEDLPPLSYEEYSADIIVGESVRKLPVEARPSSLAPLLPSATMRHLDNVLALQPERADESADPFYDGKARADYCEERGIDVQFINPSFGFGPVIASLRTDDPRLKARACRAWNTYAAERVFGFEDRLMPVAQTNLEDVDWTIAEMTRMRAAGSRAFSLQVGAPGGKFLSHPDFERVWSAAEDLGMAAYVHQGIYLDAVDATWAALNGRDLSTFAAVQRLGLGYGITIPLLLSALAFDGVFERHPNLTVIVSEAGHSWVPGLLARLDMLIDRVDVTTDPQAFVDVDPRSGRVMATTMSYPPGSDPWAQLPLRPSEYLQRQVRVAPLCGIGAIEPLRPTIEDPRVAQMLVFATDFAHPEGRTDAVALYDAELDGCGDQVRASFFGGSIADRLAL